MSDQPIHILMIEDNPGDVRLLKEMLLELENVTFLLTQVTRISDLPFLSKHAPYDVILLDLSLPDSFGIHTLTQAQRFFPASPIVVLTGANDDQLGLDAVTLGAQDYLIKGQVDSSRLLRALRYAMKRHEMHATVQTLALQDELTGLYNRRGFMALTEQQMKIANRSQHYPTLLFLDMDNMKEINDTSGHQAGDQALAEIADILRNTFRSGDILGRLGGDEFAVLLSHGAIPDVPMLIERFQENLARHNSRPHRIYRLSMSIGFAHHDPAAADPLTDLIERADAAMYYQKRLRKNRAA